MKKLLGFATIIAALYSCSESVDDSPTSNTILEKGFLIVNEGNFQSANGSVSYVSEDLSKIDENIFKTVNNRTVGDVTQSLVTTDTHIFIVVNNSNTIEVVDRKTFKSVATISNNLYSPRYAIVKNNKLYVTNMKKAEISIFNSQNFNYIKSIPLDYNAENIVATNDYIYVANNFYSEGKLVEIIDPNTDTNVSDISFEKPINGLTSDTNNVYVLDTDNTNSTITKISAKAKTNVLKVTQSNARYAVIDNNMFYYTSGTGIYKVDNNLLAVTKLFDVPDNNYSTLYGFNVMNSMIFTSDANGFTDKGKVTIYNINGNIIKTFTAGIGPCGFYKF